ncbi:MAG TPA: dihydrofolate reductase family protein, partial [Fimbriimonadaceae bacterium]|nr:dihydrofolate reductase family protein [Fimbriimonadaceae bacterium]
PDGVRVLEVERLSDALGELRKMGIARLLVEGGSELNATLLEGDLADELFLTIAPKVKLGRETPTYAGGDPLPRERMQRYDLLERHQVGDELFLRYRREF